MISWQTAAHWPYVEAPFPFYLVFYDRAATPATRPPRPSRHAAHGLAAGPGDLDPVSRDPLVRSVPAGAGSALPSGQSADSGRHRRRRSTGRRGSKGAQHRERHQRPAPGVGLIMGVLNVQSLNPKLLELTDHLHHGRYDTMSLTETWLRPSTPSRLLTLPGYQLYRADRPDRRGYGGVALAARDGLSASPIHIVRTAAHPNSKLETLWILLKPDNRRQFILCTVYRPPRRSVTDLTADFTDLEDQFQHVSATHPNSKIFICGDLNWCLLKSDTDPAKRVLRDFMSDHSLTQCVSSPTYSTGSMLDVFITNCRSIVKFCPTKFCHFSPHKFIHVSVTMPRFKLWATSVRSRCFNRVDSHSLILDLARADWSAVFSQATVTDKWNNFVAIFLSIINVHAPVRSVKIRNPSAPVVSDSTKALMSRRRGALAAFGHGSSQYRDANRAVRSAIRRDTRQDVERRIREGSRESMWRLIRPVVGSKRAARKLPDATPDDLNRYFVGVGPVSGCGGGGEAHGTGAGRLLSIVTCRCLFSRADAVVADRAADHRVRYAQHACVRCRRHQH